MFVLRGPDPIQDQLQRLMDGESAEIEDLKLLDSSSSEVKIIWEGKSNDIPPPCQFVLTILAYFGQLEGGDEQVKAVIPEKVIKDAFEIYINYSSRVEDIEDFANFFMAWQISKFSIGVKNQSWYSNPDGPFEYVKSCNNNADNNTNYVCGYANQIGDIIWRCRDCGTDDYCVQCNTCYQASDHIGHDVTFSYKRTAGGCCDCGDLEAWRKEGTCSAHKRKNDNASSLNDMNHDPTQGLDEPFRETTKYLIQTAVAFLCNQLLEYCDSFHLDKIDQNLVKKDETCFVRLHNDDIHTFDEVIETLMSLELTKGDAEELTIMVDQVGSAIVPPQNVNNNICDGIVKSVSGFQRIRTTTTLITSLTNKSFLHNEEVALTILTWLKKLTTLGPGVIRLIAEAFMSSLPFREDDHCLQSTYMKLSEKEIDGKGFITPEIHGSKCNISDLDIELSPISSSPLSWSILMDSFLPKRNKVILHDLYMSLFIDPYFKKMFADLFTASYLYLYSLFFVGIGTEADHLFHTALQVYTSPSIVNNLSINGVQSIKPSSEGKRLRLPDVVISSLRFCLIEAGCTIESSADDYRNNLGFLHDRHKHVFRDMKHIFVVPSIIRHFLFENKFDDNNDDSSGQNNEAVNFEAGNFEKHILKRFRCNSQPSGDDEDKKVFQSPVSKWFDILFRFQLCDEFVRKTDTHVEYEINRITEYELGADAMRSADVMIASAFNETNNNNESNIDNNNNNNNNNDDDDDNDRFKQMTIGEVAEDLGVLISEAMLYWLWEAKSSYSKPKQFGPPVSLSMSGAMSGPLRMDTFTLCHKNFNKFQVIDFKVHSDSCSISIPLHRVFAKVILKAAERNLPLPILKFDIEENSELLLAHGLMEYPLRVFAFSSQVLAGMWRRNGIMINEYVHIYCQNALSGRTYRDLDLVCIQYGTILLSKALLSTQKAVEFLVTSMLCKYDLYSWFLNHGFILETYAKNRRFHSDQLLIFAEYFLNDFIVFVTELPAPPGEDSVVHSLERKIIHQLAFGECTHSEIVSKIENPLSSDDFEALLKKVSVKKESNENSSSFAQCKPAKYDLDKNFIFQYDPCYVYLSRRNHQAALERIIEKRKGNSVVIENVSIPTTEGLLFPCVLAPPPCHPDFRKLRLALYTPEIITMQFNMLSYEKEGKEHQKSENIMNRIIQIFTLQLHCYDEALEIENELESSKHKCDEDRNVNLYLRRISTNLDFPESILSIMVFVFNQGRLAPLFKEGMHWILRTLASRSTKIKDKLSVWNVIAEEEKASAAASLSSSSSSSSTTTGQLTLAERKKRAKEKALSDMKKRQTAFAKSLSEGADLEETKTDLGEDISINIPTDDSNVDVSQEDEEDTVECIMCREKTDELVSYVGFAQRSSLCSRAISQNPERSLYKMNTYQCIAQTAVPVRVVLEKEGSPIPDFTFNYGDLIEVQEIKGKHMKVKHMRYPACWVSSISEEGIPLFIPIQRHAFQCWGNQRLHLSFCGHSIHRKCWKRYFETTFTRNYDGMKAADISHGEFVCPLCKTVGNVLIPYIPKNDNSNSVNTTTTRDGMTFIKWLNDGDDNSMVTTEDSSSSSISFLKHNPDSTFLSNNPQLEENIRQMILAFYIVSESPWIRNFLETHEEVASPGDKPRKNAYTLTHLVWSTLAYTITMQNMIERQSKSNSGISRNKEKNLSSLLVFFNSLKYCFLLFPKDIFTSSIKKPIILMLRGEMIDDYVPKAISECTDEAEKIERKEIWIQLQSFPLQAIFDYDFYRAEPKNTNKNVEEFLRFRALQSLRRKALKKGFSSEEVWPFLRKPLLACDLMVLAVGMTTSNEIINDTLAIVQILCVARLAQILLEMDLPDCEDTIMEHDDEENSDLSMDCKILILLTKSVLRQKESDTEIDKKINSKAILSSIYSMWLPFLMDISTLLRIATSINSKISTDDNENINEAEIDIKTKAETLLNKLSLPKLLELGKSKDIQELFSKWGEQYKVFYNKNSHGTDDDNERKEIVFWKSDVQGKYRKDDHMKLYKDYSHLGLYESDKISLIPLPTLYTTLCSEVAVKCSPNQIEHPALCLVCGEILSAKRYRLQDNSVGECTRHARHCGAGFGCLLLIHRSDILLIRGSRAVMFPSVYLDSHGEEDIELRRGKSLSLNQNRYDKLQEMYISHQLPIEAASIRGTAERTIRENYY